MVRTPLLLSLPGSCVGTLVGELRSHKLCGTAKKKKKKVKKNEYSWLYPSGTTSQICL